jgi:hypothetical protein
MEKRNLLAFEKNRDTCSVLFTTENLCQQNGEVRLFLKITGYNMQKITFPTSGTTAKKKNDHTTQDVKL